ncbi:MAG: hypothetical protein J5726_07270 [Treponema sp.]|nr:hypothetical protein [Treponema sp.]
MKYEQLKPNTIIPELEERLLELRESLKKLNESVSKHTSESYSLRIAQKNGHPQYYYVTKNTYPAGTYIPKNKQALAQKMAQKDYNEKSVKLLQKEINATERYLKQACAYQSKAHAISKIQALYNKMCPARQNLINPLTLTNEQYAAQWKNATWQGLPFAQDAPVYTTTQGERVRSKSEVLIANALAQHGIPYHYEYPLTLRRHQTHDTSTLHPDFLCLNLRTRQEFFWEHFGLMDSAEYVANAVSKLNLYAHNKITPGKNLIITMESQAEPLTPSVINQMINDFLK